MDVQKKLTNINPPIDNDGIWILENSLKQIFAEKNSKDHYIAEQAVKGHDLTTNNVAEEGEEDDWL